MKSRPPGRSARCLSQETDIIGDVLDDIEHPCTGKASVAKLAAVEGTLDDGGESASMGAGGALRPGFHEQRGDPEGLDGQCHEAISSADIGEGCATKFVAVASNQRREDRVAVVEPERVLLHSKAGIVSIRGIGDRLRLRRAPDTIDTAFDGRCKLCEVERFHAVELPLATC